MTASELRPTIRGVAALIAFGFVVVSAVGTGTPELAPLAVIIGVPLAASPLLAHFRARRALGAAEFHAHVEPGAVAVGSRMQVKLSVTNRSTDGSLLPPLGLASVDQQWQARGSEHDDAPRRRWFAPSMATIDGLPRPFPGRTETWLLAVPTGRRGVLQLPPQQAWTYDPLGLVGATGPKTPAVLAVIYPVPIRPVQLIAGIPAELAGTESTGVSFLGSGLGELEGIRPYVAGDRLGLLHWPAKARYGTWFVRQFGAEGTAARSIVLDDRAGVHRRAEFDQLISAAMWVIAEMLDERRAVHLLTLAGRSYTFEPTDRGAADARLALAELQPFATDSLTGLLAMAPGAVVLTTRTGAERLTQRAPGRGVCGAPDGHSIPAIGASRVVVV